MNQHVQMFMRIFCIMGLLGFGVGTILALSSTPVKPALVVVFAAVTLLMAGGLVVMRPRTEL